MELTRDQLESFDAGLAMNHRLVSLAAYGPPFQPRFAGIWADDPSPPPRTIVFVFDAGTDHRHLLNILDGLQEQFAQDEMFPIHITATGAVGTGAPMGLCVVVVFEQLPEDPGARFEVARDPDDLRTGTRRVEIEPSFDKSAFDLSGILFGAKTAHVDPPVSFDMCYSTVGFGPPVVHYLALFNERRPHSTLWSLTPLGGVADSMVGLPQSAQHRAVLQGFSRGHHAVPAPANVAGKRPIIVHYRDDTYVPWPDDIQSAFDGGTPIDGPLRLSELTANVNQRSAVGYQPLMIGANGRGQHVRFAVTWARNGKVKPLPRVFVAVHEGDVPPETIRPTFPTAPASRPKRVPAAIQALLDEIDARAKDQLIGTATHALQLGVAKNGRLKIMRSYTLGEHNYPITHHDHKFRLASVSKLMVGLRAVSFANPSWLNQTVEQAFNWPKLDAPTEKVAWFRQTRVKDLLRYATGWANTHNITPRYDYDNAIFKLGHQSLPLKAGYFRDFLETSNLEFVRAAPAEKESYNNGAFIALGELVSFHATKTFDQFIEVMRDFWMVGDAARVIAATREESLDWGEPPRRGQPGLAYATTVPTQTWKQSALLTPPGYRPRNYSGGADWALTAGSGGLTMSCKTLLQILQGMYPTPPPPVRNLLTAAHLDLVLETDPNVQDIQGEHDHGTFGLAGARAEQVQLAGRTVNQIAKSGGDTGTGTVAYHWWWTDAQGAPQHLSLAILAMAGFSSLKDRMLEIVEEIESLGYFDDADNYFT